MKNRIIGIFMMFVLLAALFSGCGAAKADRQATGSSSAPVSSQKAKTFSRADAPAGNQGAFEAATANNTPAVDSKTAANTTTAVVGTGVSGKYVSNPILNERKIIRNANVSVEVEDFDKAYGKLESMIAAIGYIQETKINKDKYYVADKEVLKTRGTIVIRVDADKFGQILKDVKGLGLLLDENIRSDDVTDQFFDTESRLRLVRYEESRLEEYLKKITDPDTIFKTEARLTEIRHEIESLTGNLNKLSNLVQLSTITINMSEKVPEAEKTGSYWHKLASGFTDSFRGVVSFCGQLVIAVVSALPVLALICVIAFLAFILYRKFIRRHSKHLTQKDEDLEN